MKLTEYQKGFVEALLDERGHIFLAYHDGRKNGREIYYPTINIMLKSNSMWVLEKARNMLDVRKGFNRRGKLYTLTLGELESEELLKQITLIKREQRRLVALELIDIKKKWIVGSCDKVLPEYKSEVDRLVKNFHTQGGN
jgi:hypothetical protein